MDHCLDSVQHLFIQITLNLIQSWTRLPGVPMNCYYKLFYTVLAESYFRLFSKTDSLFYRLLCFLQGLSVKDSKGCSLRNIEERGPLRYIHKKMEKEVTAHKWDVRVLWNSQCLLFDIYSRLFCTVLLQLDVWIFLKNGYCTSEMLKCTFLNVLI